MQAAANYIAYCESHGPPWVKYNTATIDIAAIAVVALAAAFAAAADALKCCHCCTGHTTPRVSRRGIHHRGYILSKQGLGHSALSW